MSDLKSRLAKALALPEVKGTNLGDVLREEGVQWEHARTRKLVEALVECVLALETIHVCYVPEHYDFSSDRALAAVEACLEEMECGM